MYLKAPLPPGSPLYRIFDAETGAELHKVVEVNSDEGWLIQAVTDEDGNVILDGDEFRLERIERRVRIEAVPGKFI